MATLSSQNVTGFIFAFYHYSQVPNVSLMQSIVRVLTRSDRIHVAIIPVWHCEFSPPDSPIISHECTMLFPETNTSHHYPCNHHIKKDNAAHDNDNDDDYKHIVVSRRKIRKIFISNKAYTAFIGSGFQEQDSASILVPEYELLFLPVMEDTNMNAGLNFLKRLHGAQYNYLALFLAALPRSFKWRSKIHFPSWLTHEVDALHPQTNDTRVFCSQIGCMLCYICNALPKSEDHNDNIYFMHDDHDEHIITKSEIPLDPAACSPNDLAYILYTFTNATPCMAEQVVIIQSDYNHQDSDHDNVDDNYYNHPAHL